MKIRKVERFEIEGREFQTLAKAQDYVDGEVNSLLTKEILANKMNMISMTDIVKLTDILLLNRERFAALLSVTLEDEDE